MKKRSAWSRRDCRPTPSMMGLACASVMLALGLVLAGCGGGSADTDTTAPATAEQPTITTEQAASTESMDGSELADAIFATWTEAMQKLNTLLADRPDPASVQTQVEQLKEEYIQKLVALGHQVAALDLGEKATMQAKCVRSGSNCWRAGSSWRSKRKDLSMPWSLLRG